MGNLLMDIFFPQNVCCICREPGRFGTKNPWCSSCDEVMNVIKQELPICDKCGKYMVEDKHLCSECSSKCPEFNIARAVGPYEEPYRIVVKVFKFLGRKNLAVKMGFLMAQAVLNEPRFWPIDLIVPVPTTKSQLKQRGFNQTELLAKQISKHLKTKADLDVLYRIKETPAQRELSKEEREKNLLCAFRVKDKQKVYEKNILLVDDIYTTGSTGRECTRTLIRGGAKSVSIITWATGKGF